jgi:hypothetical protein
MSNYENLTSAIRELGKYYNVGSVDEFRLRAVSGVQPEGGPVVTGEELIFNDIVGVQDGGYYIHEIMTRFNAQTASPEATSTWPKIFQICHATGVGSSAISSPKLMSDIIPNYAAGYATTPAPTKAKPSICSIQVLPAKLNYGIRDTGNVEVFMNAIPTLEWSRAVPFVDITVITPGGPVDSSNRLQGISLLRFLNGQSIVGTNELIAATASPLGVIPPPVPSTPGEGASESPEVFSAAGMEIFTAPQTLIPANETYRSYASMGDSLAAGDGPEGAQPFPGQPGSPRTAPILDRMRPFMTFESFKIKVVPTRGMMSHKSAEATIILHDRSRLGEIASLVTPGAFGKTELLIEYGWSHPDPSSRNPYGQFINAQRCREKFGVVNSKYSFTDDGQVTISLTLVTRGAENFNTSNIGISPEIAPQYEAFEELIQLVRVAVREVTSANPSMADLSGISQIANLSPTSASGIMNGEDAAVIQGFISQYVGGTGGPALATVASTLGEIKSSLSTMSSTIGGVITAKNSAAASNGTDPFLWNYATSKSRSAVPNVQDNSEWCSFGKLCALFVASPIAQTHRFNEVQLIYYTFNDKSSFMFNQNVANFPIKMTGNTGYTKLFDSWMEEKVQVSVSSWLQFMNRYFLSSMAAHAYGFQASFSRNEEGVASVIEGVNFANQRGAVLSNAYGSNSELEFKLPRIRMVPECVPHVRAESSEAAAPNETGTILRIHFFDDNASKYAGLYSLLASARTSGLRAIMTKAGEAGGGEDDSNWAEIQSHIDAQAAAVGIKVDASNGYAQIVGGAPAIKHFIKSQMPSITYGSQNCSMKDLKIQSMHNSADTTIHMIRAQREQSDPSSPGEQDRGLPIRIMPVQGSATSMGCPMLNFGQQFFIDLGTGTSADDIYAVSGLEHDIQSGKFETKMKLIPLGAMGTYTGMASALDRAIAELNSAGGTAPTEGT